MTDKRPDLRISLATAPGPDTERLAVLAEELGYSRYWLYDSPALYEDIWIALGRVAGVTDRIGLGTAVLVPNSRHPMVTASAIATMERLAPGRCTYAFGTGASARWAFDQPPLTWRFMATYLSQLRALLAGETVEIEGRPCAMLHHPDLAVARPIEVPLVLSAFGPKGMAVARELDAGIMSMFPPPDGITERIQLVAGTVLDEGETVADRRVAEAVGPWYVVTHHALHQSAPETADALPGGAEWRAGIEATRPAGDRHLAVWEGHVTHLVDRDATIVDAAGEQIVGMSWVGSADEIRDRVDEAATGGVTEIAYAPAGPDVEREIRSFAAATLG